MPRPLSQLQPVDPTCIGPKIQHMPFPPYYDPYVRPQLKPPDMVDPLDSWKDLLENDSDRKVEIEENSPFQEVLFQRSMRDLTRHMCKNLRN